MKGFGEDQFLFMATKKGIVKKTAVSEFANIRKVGLIALSLDDDDVLIGVKATDGESNLMLGTKQGMAICLLRGRCAGHGQECPRREGHCSA